MKRDIKPRKVKVAVAAISPLPKTTTRKSMEGMWKEGIRGGKMLKRNGGTRSNIREKLQRGKSEKWERQRVDRVRSYFSAGVKGGHIKVEIWRGKGGKL